MAIHKTELGCYAIAAYGTWRPGVYESERTARYAFRFSDDQLRQLQNEVNAKETDHNKRVITFAMLQKLRKNKEHIDG